MTNPHPMSATEQSASSDDEQVITDGRYLYCLADTTTAEPSDLSTTGIGDNRVYVIETQNTGAVVHECETIYDTDDLEQVKQWLLTHQHVVDAASDVFGTPLPMRFDTILKGGDTSVEQWLREHHDRIREELTSFAGMWEYRTHLLWEPSVFEERIADQDEELQELQQRQQRAGAGKRFLLEKQYDKRLRELKQNRRVALAKQLHETVRPVVNELAEQDSQSPLQEPVSSAERERVTQLAVLADKEHETALGDRLDTLVEQESVEIRFTGPWPPYTFAPTFE